MAISDEQRRDWRETFFLRRISLQQFIAIHLQQWRTSHCMVQRVGNHEEEGAKMIMSIVLVALRKSLKCLSLACSGQTTLKVYFINLACVLCLWGGGEASSSLWARFVTGTVGKCLEKERHMPYGILWAQITSEGALGHRQRRHRPWVPDQLRKKEFWWSSPLLDHQSPLCASSLLLGYPSLFPLRLWAVVA